jgi:hypothetical protein
MTLFNLAMNKYFIITILILLPGISPCQQFVKTTTPCNEELLKKTPGRWINVGEGLHAKISNQQLQEIRNRLGMIQQFVFNLCPSPIGFDASWSRFTSDEHFASNLKIVRLSGGGINTENTDGIPCVYYQYYAQFSPYGCGREPYEMRRGWPSEDGSRVIVHVNRLEGCFARSISDNPLQEVMRVDGRPVKMMPVLQGKWKGYDVYGGGTKIVLLHREGMLPYIPVTRKQYLDRCIEFLTQFLIPDPKSLELMADKRDRDELIQKYQRMKDEVLTHYKEELVATGSAGLLDSPAIIQEPICDISSTSPIFIKLPSGGTMLVTENPAYLRKDLPLYIPQFMVFSWSPYYLAMNPYKAIDENFPVEKLQAMIDK